jgi:RNA polymerase sigma-70 factor (ECF subfamily)
MAQPDDLSDLLRDCARGEKAAFAELYRRSAPQLFGLTLRMLKRRDLAEEVLQEAFVRIWQRAGTYDPEKGAPLTWMASIVRNRTLDRLRARRPEQPLDEEARAAELADPAPSPLDAALRSAEARALLECLKLLEEGPRDAILRVYYGGLTHAELGALTGTPLGTLKSWIRRGLQRLKGCLEG